MRVRLTVEVGPDGAELEQVLDVDLDDLDQAARMQLPAQWSWTVAGGVMRLAVHSEEDTPDVP